MVYWPDSIPSGQRSIKSETSMVRKSIANIRITFPDDDEVNLFEDNELISEDHRLIFIFGALGIFSGVRNASHGDYVLFASYNASDDEELAPPNIRAGGRYDQCVIHIDWTDKDKNSVRILVEELMDEVFHLGRILYRSKTNNEEIISKADEPPKEELSFEEILKLTEIPDQQTNQ